MRLNVNSKKNSVIAIFVTILSVGHATAQNTPHNSRAELREVIQPKLAYLGLYDGPIDGIYGPMTRRAIIAFERRLLQRGDGYLDDSEIATLRARAKTKRQFFPFLRGHWSGKLQCDSGLDWNAQMEVAYSNNRGEYVVTYGQSAARNPRLIEGVNIAPFTFYMPNTISFIGNDGDGYRVSYQGTLNIATNSAGSRQAATSIQARGYRGRETCDLVLVPTNQKWRLDALVNALPRNLVDQDAIAAQEAEAERIAQEAEAERVAKAAETARLAEEARLARIAAREETRRLAEAARLEAIEQEAQQARLQARIAQDQAESANLIADSVKFIQQGNAFDINFPIEYSKVVGIENVSWNAATLDVYQRFRNYVTASDAFNTFHQSETDRRQREHDETVAFLQSEITTSVDSIREWVLANQLNPSAATMLNIATLNEGKATETNLDALTLAVTSLQADIRSEGVRVRIPLLEPTSKPNVVEPEQVVEAKPVITPFVDNDLRLRAPMVIADAESFVKLGIGRFDREFALLYQKSASAAEGNWNETLAGDYANFETFVMNSATFSSYHISENERRSRENQVAIQQAQQDLSSSVSLVEGWVDENLLSPHAARALEMATEAKAKASSGDLVVLNAEIISIYALMNEIGIYRPSSGDALSANAGTSINGDTMTVYVNLSGRAAHAYRNIDGAISFENNQATVCVADTVGVDLTTLYYLRGELENLVNPTELADFNECSSPIIKTSDIVISSGRVELSQDAEYASIMRELLSASYEAIGEVTKDQISDAQSQDLILQETIASEIQQGTRIGYGAISYRNNSRNVCYTPTTNIEAQQYFITSFNGLAELAIGGPISKTIQTDPVTAFRQVQRGRCGIIYADEANLEQIYRTSLANATTTPNLLPVWFGPRQIEAKQQEIAGDN